MKRCVVPTGKTMCAIAALALIALPLHASGADRVVLGEYFTWNG